MFDMFLYNWQVREDWFKWCESLSIEEFQAERIGGMGSILKNMIHVIDCELLWINYILEEPESYPEKNSIKTLVDVISYSNFTKGITENLIRNMTSEDENRKIQIKNRSGKTYSFTYGKVIRHIITHEIHHIGQLSIWSREMGIKPISSDLIVRHYT